jgi:hypothetical protein
MNSQKPQEAAMHQMVMHVSTNLDTLYETIKRKAYGIAA